MKKITNFVRVVAFILLVSVLLGYWNELFKFKDPNGMSGMDIYYRQPENSVDMIIVGSSHAFVGYNTGTLWDEYGIASYVLGANVQHLSNAYHYIQEALKTQNPQLIVLEAYLLTAEADYLGTEYILHNTYGMHFSEDSMDTMNDNVPPDEDILDYGLTYGRYHARYDEITSLDFTYGSYEDEYYNCFKGYHNLFGIATNAGRPHFNPRRDLTCPVSIKAEYYYRKICQLCQDEGIELSIVIAPYSHYTDRARQQFNLGRQIAAEYGFAFVDHNECYDEFDLDFARDFFDQGHLNVFGTRKYTSYFGRYIDAMYNLPDRRLDDSGLYDTWEMNARFLEMDYYNYTVMCEWGAVDYFAAIRDLPEEYIIILTITNPRNLGPETKRFLGYYHIPCIRYDDEHVWIVQAGTAHCYEQDENGMYFEEYYGPHHLAISPDGVYIDGGKVYLYSSGVEMVIFNELYGEIVEGVTLNNDDIWRDA